MPIFRAKSVKIYTGQKKIYTSAARGARDKYEVCTCGAKKKERGGKRCKDASFAEHGRD